MTHWEPQAVHSPPRPRCLPGAPVVCQAPTQSRERDRTTHGAGPKGSTPPTMPVIRARRPRLKGGDGSDLWVRQLPSFSPCFSSACCPLSSGPGWAQSPEMELSWGSPLRKHLRMVSRHLQPYPIFTGVLLLWSSSTPGGLPCYSPLLAGGKQHRDVEHLVQATQRTSDGARTFHTADHVGFCVIRTSHPRVYLVWLRRQD